MDAMNGIASIMTSSFPLFLLLTASVSAFICGMNVWRHFDAVSRERKLRRSIVSEEPLERKASSNGGGVSIDERVIGYMESLSRSLNMGNAKPIAPGILRRISARRFCVLRSHSGVSDAVSLEGYCECQARLAMLGAFAGLLIGAIFSEQLAILLTAAGAVAGFMTPGKALKSQAARRTQEAERHLPEMLDVVALGMRSGMSFDTSLSLYGKHFDTMLSRELMNSQRQWMSGLATREDALRKVASTYDSPILSRTVETIIRSVRYGTSMVESMESDAAEARASYQSGKEEKVAKAPVKMMIPTGVFILPAMLLLVLGPVLLELMGGAI